MRAEKLGSAVALVAAVILQGCCTFPPCDDRADGSRRSCATGMVVILFDEATTEEERLRAVEPFEPTYFGGRVDPEPEPGTVLYLLGFDPARFRAREVACALRGTDGVVDAGPMWIDYAVY